MVYNDQTLQTHGCIALGASGNRQGSLKLFDLKLGKVVTRRVFKVIPMPDIVVKLVNNWGMQFKKENRKNKLELLNRHRKKFYWYNKQLDDDENVEEFQQKLVHPDIIAEIPGVELENYYKYTVGPALQLEEEPIKDIVQLAEDDRKNFDRGKNVLKTHDQIKGVDDVIKINSGSDSDHDEYEL